MGVKSRSVFFFQKFTVLLSVMHLPGDIQFFLPFFNLELQLFSVSEFLVFLKLSHKVCSFT
jgi:hypothetical protein